MTDKADGSIVLAELQIALFRECNNQGLSPWGITSLVLSMKWYTVSSKVANVAAE